jgi:hypothetical protein
MLSSNDDTCRHSISMASAPFSRTFVILVGLGDAREPRVTA